ncbi:MAG: GNAT family N-acetyltransferase [Anaerolineae bacterium]|jgi:GNAT superfamily N-acetyltransferase
MSVELELTKANRIRLARAFWRNKRVDYSIDCVVEGQMGQAFADSAHQPTAYCITVGPFWYFAGDADSPDGRLLLREFPMYGLLMPSPPEWIAAAHQVFQGGLVPFTRYRFSPDQVSETHLVGLFENSACRERVVPLDAELVAQAAAEPESYLEIGDFDSPADFLERGLGYAALEDEQVIGVAYSSLVCSRGIEVSVYVEEDYRERGVGTALASRLLLECTRWGMRPNWDAANPESCKLAMKLGCKFVDAYDAYYYWQEPPIATPPRAAAQLGPLRRTGSGGVLNGAQ